MLNRWTDYYCVVGNVLGTLGNPTNEDGFSAVYDQTNNSYDERIPAIFALGLPSIQYQLFSTSRR